LRRQVGGDSKYEVEFGYSRAVRVGSIVLVAATSGSDQPEPELAPDTYAHAKRELGLEDFKRAYREFFADIRPALSLVYVSGFPSDKTILEIEAEALKDG
jgi:enamine deaminase RidA (YjgF/YER057c/UK114 family)